MAAASSTGSFVGRERELGDLRGALDQAGSGHGRLFLLSGEPGIGKTRLAEEIAAEAAAQGVRVVWGRCWEGDGAPAYWPWIQVLRACLAVGDAERRAAILAVEATPRIVQDIAQLLPELYPAHLQNVRPRGPQLSDPEQARFQLFESVTSVLKNVARMAPILIIIDDLHDADHLSLLMQKFIAAQIKDARVLMVGTYRDTEVRQSPELSKLIGDLTREGHSLPMAGLTEREVGQFIANSSGTKADETLVADLYQATDGNPLFVDGVVRLLVAEGKFDRGPLGGGTFRIPDGVRESIRRRLLRLSEETNLLLSMASVIGNEFEPRLLSQFSTSSAKEIIERMEDAIRAGIVTGGVTGGKRYRFSHALIREALYQELAINRRIELHGQIGSSIEEVCRADLQPHLAALAHHFREGGITEKAIDYSILAADAAEAVFAYNDALAHLRPALALVEIQDDRNSGRRALILLRLGHIQIFFENRDQGVAHLETALKIFDQTGDDQHAGEIHSDLGCLFAPTGPQLDVDRALMHLERAEVLLATTSDSYALGMVYWGLALASLQAMRINEALAASQKAMNLFAEIGNREAWTLAAANRTQMLMAKGKIKQAIALLDEIAGTAAGFVNPNTFTHRLSLSAWFWLLMRHPRKAIDCYQQALKRPILNLVMRGQLFQFLTICELAVGNLAEARRLAGDNFVNQAFRARIAFYEGDWETARQTLQQAVDWARGIGAKWEELNMLAYVVELLRVIGDYNGAAEALARAVSLYLPDDVFWEIRLRPHAVLLCFDAGWDEEAGPHLEYCRAVLEKHEDWLGLGASVSRAEAVMSAIQGRFQESDLLFEKTITAYKQYSLLWEEAEALHYWGRALLRAGEKHRANEKLDAAIKMYRDYGAGQCWIERVEADKRRMSPQPHADLGSSGPDNREAIFRDEGEFWTIAYLGHSFRLRDMRGLHYIAYLLAHPDERFHVRDLAVLKQPLVEADRGDAAPILDHQAKAEYRAKLSELRAALDDAEGMNDSGRAEGIRREIEFVNDELSAAIGLGGRDRKTADDGERARLRIGKAIRSAVTAVRERDPSLGHHFTTCIRTGYYCAYLPDPLQLPSWKL
jgi:tetratricopeptide (TPR) repeat protein